MNLLTVVIILALLATMLTLLLGLMSLGQGRKFDQEFGTRFMWARVGLQATAVVLLILALILR
jgi:hypothetical protein